MDFSFLDKSLNDPDLYAVIGADETSSIEQIKAEFKHKAKKLHPDKAALSDYEGAHREFERLKWAYEILSNKEARDKYDFWRRSGLAMPFKAWLKLDDSSRTSMHWALKPRKRLMLADNEISQETGNDIVDASISTNNGHISSGSEEQLQVNERLVIQTNGEVKQKRTLMKQTFNGFGSSRLSSKFHKYEI